MINGVLTERTVEEVAPILQTNSDGLKKALEELVKQYKSKQDEMEKWKVCIRVSLLRHVDKAVRTGCLTLTRLFTEEEQCASGPAARPVRIWRRYVCRSSLRAAAHEGRFK